MTEEVVDDSGVSASDGSVDDEQTRLGEHTSGGGEPDTETTEVTEPSETEFEARLIEEFREQMVETVPRDQSGEFPTTDPSTEQVVDSE